MEKQEYLSYPTLKQIQEAKEKLRSLIIETPAHPWHDPLENFKF